MQDYLDYLDPWHLPLLVGVLPVLWIVLGGYLFQKGLIKHTIKRRIPLSDGIIASLLSGGAGGAVAIIPILVVMMKMKSIPALIVASLLALAVTPAAAWNPETRIRMIDEAVRLMPASLRLALERHRVEGGQGGAGSV